MRADHCFLRIAYDVAAGAKWDTRFARPAWRTMPEAVLHAALEVIARIDRDGRQALVELNAISLAMRGIGTAAARGDAADDAV